MSILKTNDFGIIPQHATAGGLNIFYEPKYTIVSNPLLPDLSGEQLIIGKDCEVIKLMPDWSGIIDIVSKYAGQMALCTESLQSNLFNSQMSIIFGAEDKTAAKAFKEMYDRVHRGEPAVAVGKNYSMPMADHFGSHLLTTLNI